MSQDSIIIDETAVKFEHFKCEKSRRIARLKGVREALIILKRCSLRQLYISHNPVDKSETSRLLGHDVHLDFSKRWGYEHIKMPNVEHTIKQLRNAAIWEDARVMKIAHIALKYQMTIRNVQLILKAYEQDNETTREAPKVLQLDLF